MPIEFEAKFLNIDRDAMRQRLQAAGYACHQPDRLMRRVVFDTPHSDGQSWARVRDEGHRIAVTYKRTHDLARVDGTEEVEVTVGDFDAACRLLEALGAVRKSYQETRREIWLQSGIEAVLDEWPCLPPFMEVEGPDEAGVRAAAAALGLAWDAALFGPVGVVYETIGIPHEAINRAPCLTFENTDDILALRRTA